MSHKQDEEDTIENHEFDDFITGMAMMASKKELNFSAWKDFKDKLNSGKKVINTVRREAKQLGKQPYLAIVVGYSKMYFLKPDTSDNKAKWELKNK